MYEKRLPYLTVSYYFTIIFIFLIPPMPKARGFTLLAVNLNSQLGGSGFDHTFKGVAVCGFPFGGHASFFAQGGTKFCVPSVGTAEVLRDFR